MSLVRAELSDCPECKNLGAHILCVFLPASLGDIIGLPFLLYPGSDSDMQPNETHDYIE